MKWLKYILLLLMISCVQDPTAPVKNIADPTVSEGAYIICEGIWGQSNASLARYDSKNGEMINGYFSNSNPNLSLGDLANDIVIYGDTAFVAVTSARAIEAFLVSTGKSIGRIILPANSAPREIAIQNDTTAYVSDLYLDVLHKFNPAKMELKGQNIKTGPAPEAVAFFEDKLFVANSGYGYYRRNEPKAGTVSIIDPHLGVEFELLEDMPNVVELLIDQKTKKLYCCYYHITAEFDSVGGIVEYDLNTFKKTRRWVIDALSIEFSPTQDSLFFISNNNIFSLDLSTSDPPALMIENPKPAEIWYALAVSPLDNSLWVFNAKNHQMNGELLIYDIFAGDKPKNVHPLGVNPSKAVFF
jgi:DNA-binding beta-propeller fold protein YncE